MNKADQIALWFSIAILAFCAFTGTVEVQQAHAQAPPGDYCLARWVWNEDDKASPFWEPPFRASYTGGLDMRSQAQQAQKGGTGGWGWFAYDQPMGATGMDCYGSDLDAQLRASQVAVIEMVLGKDPGSIQGRTLRSIIEELLTTDSDPSGLTGPKPLQPTHDLRVRIYLGGSQPIVDRPFKPGSEGAWWDKLLQLHQADYQRLRAADLQSGKDTYRKWHGGLLEKYHLNPSRADLLVPPALRGLADTTPLKPQTTRADDFTDTNGTALESHTPTGTNAGDAWTLVAGSAGDIEIQSNAAQTTVLGGAANGQVYRMDNALSSDSHYAQAVINSTGGEGRDGVVVRLPTGASPAQSYYEARPNTAVGEVNLIRFDNGTQNVLKGNASITWSLPDTLYMEIDGGDIDIRINGASVLTFTDNNHTGNTHAGIKGFHETSGVGTWDDFDAADLTSSSPAWASVWFFSVAQSWLRWFSGAPAIR